MKLESFIPPEPVKDYDKPEHALSVVRRPIPHDSSALQVQGAAAYVDDIPEPAGCLHVCCGPSPKAAGKLTALDLSAVESYPGVVAVIAARDVPGRNDISPVAGDEPAFCDGEVLFHQQPLFAVIAETRDAARRAARLAKVEIAAAKPLVTVEDALAADSMVQPDYVFARGDAKAAIAGAPHRVEGRFRIGGPEHFYLEGQVA
ncbi:MAG: xanthine dehydrogenase molybdopterin binding subunit, partial [Beijerinckiaceae bacterium]